jgi:hypothetical protein
MGAVLLWQAIALAAPAPKEVEEGAILGKEQLLAVLRTKREFTCQGGTYRIRVRSVDGKSLERFESRVPAEGEVTYLLRVRAAKIAVDLEKQKPTVFIDDGEVSEDGRVYYLSEKLREFAAPCQGKR